MLNGAIDGVIGWVEGESRITNEDRTFMVKVCRQHRFGQSILSFVYHLRPMQHQWNTEFFSAGGCN